MSDKTKILMRGLGAASVFIGIWGGAFAAHYFPAWMHDAAAATSIIFVCAGAFSIVISFTVDL